MKISDLHESSYAEDLNNEIMNVIMMFLKAGTDKTDINNIIAELKKIDVNVTEQDIIDFVDSSKNLSMTSDNDIVLDPDAEEDESEDVAGVERSDEYDPAKDKAKKAAFKRLKDK